MKIIAMAIGLLLIAQQALPQAQQQATAPPADQLRLRTVLATVVDAKEEYVMDLKPSDFVIEEDGEQKQIAGFSQDSPLALSIGILVDVSGSMNQLFNGAVGSGVVLLRTMKPQDEWMLMTFDRFVNVVEPFTNDRTKIEAGIRKLVSGAFGSYIYDAIGYAAKNMKAAKNRRRVLIVMTDAEDTGPSSLGDLQAILHEEEIAVYTFGLTQGGIAPQAFGGGEPSLPMKTILDTLAKTSGGRSLIVDINTMKKDSTITELLAFCQTISAEHRGQYSLGYLTTKPGNAATRVIRVKTTSPDHKVRFRRDVFPDIPVRLGPAAAPAAPAATAPAPAAAPK